MATILSGKGPGKSFRSIEQKDYAALAQATQRLDEKRMQSDSAGTSAIPTEPLKYLRSIFNVNVYGFDTWDKLFNPRQLLVMIELCRAVREATQHLKTYHTDAEYVRAVTAYLGLIVSRFADYLSNTALWEPKLQAVLPTFVRQALAMVWDYCEINPFGGTNGYLESAVERTVDIIRHCAGVGHVPATVKIANAERLPFEDNCFDIVITDPPYYDAVPYSDLSDFFYVWLKRAIGSEFPDLFRSPLTPKQAEIVQLAERNPDYSSKTKEFFEEHLTKAFREAHRVMKPDGIAVFMFAHRTTAAWETLVGAINGAGFIVTASWPIATEMAGRRRAKNSAALASSIFIVCRKRLGGAEVGYWDEVRSMLSQALNDRMDHFWQEGIRGADFFISAIGPALSVFGKYERVTKLSGEDITVGQFLDEVRGLVTNYALAKIMKTSHAGNIDGESQFYVIWRWSYADAKVPADESFKLAQALGMATETMWDRTGILEKSGENVLAMPIAKRMKIKDLGDSEADGAPASLIDVLHRLCAFREKNDSDGMAQFLIRSGQGNNPALWVVAQAMSDILPDGDKEKQLMQGLLNQKEKLEQAAEQGRLF
jgi:adenine-specific DNA methylase